MAVTRRSRFSICQILQIALCLTQSEVWQSLPQYVLILQPLHLLEAGLEQIAQAEVEFEAMVSGALRLD